MLLWSTLQSRHAFFVHYNVGEVLADFLLNVGAILIAITLYAEAPALLNTLLILPALLLLTNPPITSPERRTIAVQKVANGRVLDNLKRRELAPFPVRPFVTAYRGSMLVVTCLAILAVDFNVFPRRFAKVENWGTSLMDIGVGSFVFSAGVMAAKPILKAQMAGKPSSLAQDLYVSGKHSMPLLILGLIRLYSVKGLDYAEHVTEYGVHWNFFFTLAFLPPFAALFRPFFLLAPFYELLSVSVGCIYQGLLEITNLKAFMLTAPRVDWLSKNREGIFSLFGYFAIFLAGQATGQYILPRQQRGSSKPASGRTQRVRLLVRLTAWSAIWSFLFFCSTSYKYGFAYRVSRRLANLPYVLWVSAFNCTQILIFCIIETVTFPAVHRATDDGAEGREGHHATSRVLAAFNRNGLAVFLLANLLTGLINLTVDTLNTSGILAVIILFGYAAFLTSVALTLDSWDISIKV